MKKAHSYKIRLLFFNVSKIENFFIKCNFLLYINYMKTKRIKKVMVIKPC